jgi:hypothetical protein
VVLPADNAKRCTRPPMAAVSAILPLGAIATLILEEWPELAHKLAPKTPQG